MICQEVETAPRVEHPLRILFALHTPWTERLGVPRVAIELARHLELLGHRCSKYSQEDSGIQPGKLTGPFTTARFQRKLLRYIRRHGHQYDVIQAEHYLLPFPRKAYRFQGTFVAKSNGLAHFYHRYAKEIAPDLQREAGQQGTLRGNLARWAGRKASAGLNAVEQSFRTAHQIHLLNQDELTFVRDELGHDGKCRLVPNGLSEARAAALDASATAEQRAASATVAFVGTWSLRKGRLEFPRIVRAVREQHPQTHFRLIGTYTGAGSVKAAFDSRDRAHIDVVPEYEPDQLPNLLAEARCGIFPSYIEGFPLGLLEMLAAGVPTVAWDAPGSREMQRHLPSEFTVPAGDVEATVHQLLCLLNATPTDVTHWHEAAKDAVDDYRWATISQEVSRILAAAECRT